MSNPNPADPASAQADVLAQALAIMGPLADWLVRSGLGHAQLSQALKPVFMQAAQAELAQQGRGATDSALSLLSGLHRKDVKTLREAAPLQTAAAAPSAKISPASELATRWLARGWPLALPYAAPALDAQAKPDTLPAPSFEALARSVSSDLHPRSLLQELLRLGVASEAAGLVSLNQAAFVPNPQLAEARALLGGSVADHLAAGVHNLTAPAAQQRYLEQSVFADGLSIASTAKLQTLATGLWQPMLQAMVAAAEPLCAQDAADPMQPEKPEGDQRIRLGLFCYATPMNPKHREASDAPALAHVPAAAPAKK